MEQYLADEKGAQLGKAIEKGNGLEASRLMQDLGSCHWSQVFDTFKKLNPNSQAVMSANGNDGTGSESIHIYLSPLAFNSFARASDKTCKR